MAHPQQQQYCNEIRNQLPQFFSNVRVLDCGALDINGNNRYLFSNSIYTAIDIAPGPNIDLVSPIHLFSIPQHQPLYDTVISTEALEHDPHFPLSLRRMTDLLRPGGLLIITAASTGRPEHGTPASKPNDSPFTSNSPNWNHNHYQNLTESDFHSAIPINLIFSSHSFSTNPISCDIYFHGIKRVG